MAYNRHFSEMPILSMGTVDSAHPIPTDHQPFKNVNNSKDVSIILECPVSSDQFCNFFAEMIPLQTEVDLLGSIMNFH